MGWVRLIGLATLSAVVLVGVLIADRLNRSDQQAPWKEAVLEGTVIPLGGSVREPQVEPESEPVIPPPPDLGRQLPPPSFPPSGQAAESAPSP